MAVAHKFGRHAPAIATIRASVLLPLVDELDKRNGKTDVLLACNGIMRSQLDDAYAFVPMSRYVAIFEEAAEILHEPFLGAQLATRFKPADIGPIGVLFSVSPTIRTAFMRLSKYVAALQGATTAGVFEKDDYVFWSYKLDDPDTWPRHQDAEYSLVASCQLVRDCFGNGWRPVEIHFEHAGPRDSAVLRKIFGSPILFGQSGNRIVMHKADADRRYRNEDSHLVAILERHIADLSGDTGHGESLKEQTLSVIAIYLGHKPITVATVAAELNLSVRTLQRSLSAEGSSLRELIRQYRREIAELHLEDENFGNQRIAEALGYADSTVFGRAFKSWTGQSPSRRARQHSIR